jgi:glycosyltransferase involved in cell wall biosynthesis
MLGADVFILASRADPAPLVLSEAREAGLAVIGTRVDGIPELLESGAAGLLVPPAAPERLAAALLEVLETPQTLHHHRERSQFNLERLALSRVATETLAVYARAHRGRRPGGARRANASIVEDL